MTNELLAWQCPQSSLFPSNIEDDGALEDLIGDYQKGGGRLHLQVNDKY